MDNWISKIIYTALLCGLSAFSGLAQSLGNYKTIQVIPQQIVFTTSTGNRISIKAYTDQVIRVQVAKNGEEFLKDNHYEMVASHKMTGQLKFTEKPGVFEIATLPVATGTGIRVYKAPFKIEFYNLANNTSYLKDSEGINWTGTEISAAFAADKNEHFCGMGHQSFGLVPSLDLKGQTARCNYGDFDFNEDKNSKDGWAGQAFLTVPFFMSSKGYGIFVNSTFPHQFNFGKANNYGFKIDTRGFKGQMDYFFIQGPQFKTILERYTNLTGKPRMPQKSMFGLQLSDKGASDNEGADWWKKKVKEHRDAGYPLDHVVNDNRWRAGTGGWSGSWFEWDKTRYKNPKEYAAWCKKNGLTVTLDLNRNITSASEGYKPSYNLRNAEKVREPFSVPDYSSKEVRNWLWSLFWKKSLNPALQYPGDAIWMDEIDEMTNIPDTSICADGRSWAENRNYYPFLVAKAVVQEGWDNENKNIPAGIGEAERPFAWCRGMLAGGQRYATHWSGDLKCSYSWMQQTIRGMQTSGLSGFPYFNHDAGGFRAPGPDDGMYIQWALAMGSFSPIWRPHGMGENRRWPLDRSKVCQDAATKYATLRYQMMPYIYSMAYQAYAKGTPMARAMVVDYQNQQDAWAHDQQYMWGDALLVAPNTSSRDSIVSVWLPAGQNWYSFWNDKKFNGGQVIQFPAKFGELPVFVKEGAIIPKHAFAKSTFWIKPGTLILDIYPGKNGAYTLYEDDGLTERYKTKNERRFTEILYNDKGSQVIVKAAKGFYSKAPENRTYQLMLHGINGITVINTIKHTIHKDLIIPLK
ncbi:glycoside hydrolase family 31 protein [Pedobacter sp. MC2016-14]|uniref:glycoside hydrolase family 31 protein n=1 Tax=Pedobacter sp. MC2016-14 TaxID=2897327 RepID=UPI001E41A1CB|nr:TIM-barrel domain-containing protein [Pedobacter sp. MC2016-14]MCD0490325.1 glycoside hydrolase family 31 protein [Pedobacter sp. MC2016-14]